MTNPWLIPDRINLLGNPLPIDNSVRAKTRAFFARPAVKDTATGAAFAAVAILLTAVNSGFSMISEASFLLNCLVIYGSVMGLFAQRQSSAEKEAVYNLRGRKQDLQDIRLNTNPAKIITPSDDIQDGCKSLTHENNTKRFLFVPIAAYAVYLHFTALNPATTLAAGAVVYPLITRYLRQKECWKKVASGEYAVEGYDPNPWARAQTATPETPSPLARLKGWLGQLKAA